MDGNVEEGGEGRRGKASALAPLTSLLSACPPPFWLCSLAKTLGLGQ